MARQLDLGIPGTHGGRRRGAGRPNRSGLKGHARRPSLSGREPVHVTLRLIDGLPSLRRKDLFRALRESVRVARRRKFAVVHFSILSNHLHFIIEPRTSGELAKEMQSLAISFSRRLNGVLGRKGRVFRERYHLEILGTPTQVRNALAYVLSNESRHRGVPAARPEIRIDPFSSAQAFRRWGRLFRGRPRLTLSNWSEDVIENWLDEILTPARTWLLARGWERAAA
jgi:REP element-mobilizing transposase RayT